MTNIFSPSLYQINTRVWLTALSMTLGRPARLADIPDAELDRIAERGFDWVWFLSVWQTGLAGQHVSRSNADWRREFQETLPDLSDADIAGSGFAITEYAVSRELGGNEELAVLRQRLTERGLKLMLDFVPNHMGLDHPWVESHPEYFVSGTEDDLLRQPKNYIRIKRNNGDLMDLILAYGRDPYFPGWPDTLQLDYSKPATQQAMIGELEKISRQCDGVRCDMAMLVLPDVFERTWGRKAPLFWPVATQRVRSLHPNFCFIAEVYWDLEWTLQQQGFDYTYDKRLYDRLRDRHARPVREHLYAAMDYQVKLARFLENHDEPRAAAIYEPRVHRAAAVITYMIPGLRFFHQGQLEGRKKRISPHLVRAPDEVPDNEIEQFYDWLLDTIRNPVVKNGEWQSINCVPAWDGNGSWDSFVAFSWRGPNGQRMVIAVNYANHNSQCYLVLPFPEIKDRMIQLKDSFSHASYVNGGDDLLKRGLYLDLQPWCFNVFCLDDMAHPRESFYGRSTAKETSKDQSMHEGHATAAPTKDPSNVG